MNESWTRFRVSQVHKPERVGARVGLWWDEYGLSMECQIYRDLLSKSRRCETSFEDTKRKTSMTVASLKSMGRIEKDGQFELGEKYKTVLDGQKRKG